MKRALPLALGALLAGCAGPRPAPPPSAAIIPPPQWREASGAEAIDTAWWRGFGDPVLAKLVEQALAANIDIATAAARVEEARAQLRLARAQRLPDLIGTLGGGRERSISPFGKPEEQWAGRAGLSVSYDLDLFGRLASASAAARADLLASQAARDNVRLAVAASTASAYVNLVELDAQLQVVLDTLAAREASLRLVRRRAEAGYAPALDLRQAEAEYRAAEQAIPVIKLAIRRQEDGLAILLGQNPASIARGKPLAALALPRIDAGLPSALLRRRPDIAQAEQQLVAADRSLDSVRAAFLPSIQLSAAGGYAASTLLANPVGIFSLGGSIFEPIFDAGRLRAQQNGAAARRDQAAFAYRKAALEAFREVEDALAGVTRSGEQQASLVAQRDALAGALMLATNRYREGYSTYLEQLDAQRSLLAAELSLVQVRADRLIFTIRLFQALGGGWTAS
ncbi:efflux transporter outer membrane subunit [Rhizorhabdus argentea]|uniref:efflux transporter outer membrane subunit n=1 Tax=Rhizorhabdus argentea TaxID=1387174 RepID=UPI0030EF995F